MFYLNVFQINYCEQIPDVKTKVLVTRAEQDNHNFGYYVMDVDAASVKSNLMFEL